MDLADLDQTLKRLKSQLNSFGESHITSSNFNLPSVSGTVSSNFTKILGTLAPKYIIYLPGIILVLLLISKPSFIHDINSETEEKKINIRKLLLASVVISGVIALIGFAYLYKNKRV